MDGVYLECNVLPGLHTFPWFLLPELGNIPELGGLSTKKRISADCGSNTKNSSQTIFNERKIFEKKGKLNAFNAVMEEYFTLGDAELIPPQDLSKLPSQVVPSPYAWGSQGVHYYN